MPIKYPSPNSNEETPTETGSALDARTGFTSCVGFTFRLADVDGFYHRAALDAELSPETVVFFKGYTMSIPDPEKNLCDFLTSHTTPQLHE